MKITNPIKWGFDPRIAKTCRVLKSERGRIIWGAIKTGHIVDQYFNDNCLALLRTINKKSPKDAQDLLSMAARCGLSCFGRKCS